MNTVAADRAQAFAPAFLESRHKAVNDEPRTWSAWGPAPAAGGRPAPAPASAETPEALARRFHDLGFQQDVAAMAALLAPGAVLLNARDDVRMSDEAFLSLPGVGRAGRTGIVQTLTSGSIAVLRERTSTGGEILLVVQTDGGCVTGVTSFYD